ncbi:MAG: MFS transporter [Gammaproteobacteria bacterium]|nr:MFS transporter [Gammaproteobacteria bacterium]
MRLRLYLSGALLLVIVLGVNLILLFSTLDEFYVDAALSPYKAISVRTAAQFEQGLSTRNGLGTMSELSARMNRTLADLRSIASRRQFSLRPELDAEDVEHGVVSLMLPGGGIIHSTDEDGVGNSFSLESFGEWVDNNELVRHSQVDSFHYVAAPVRDRSGGVITVLVIGLPDHYVKSDVVTFMKRHWIVVGILLVAGVVILLLSMKRLIELRRRTQGALKTKVVVLIVCVAGVSQLILSGFVVDSFRSAYIEFSRSKIELALSDFGERATYALNATHIQDLAKESMDTFPEFQSISVYAGGNRLVSSVTREETSEPAGDWTAGWISRMFNLIWFESSYELRAPIARSSGGDVVVAEIFDRNVQDRFVKTIFDALVAAAIGVLIFVELLMLLLKYLERYTARRRKSGGNFHYSVMRPAMFLFLFGIDTSLSFLPLHMENLYEPIFGLSKDMILGLPISIEFLFVGVAILLAGIWLDRRGWHEPFMLGLVIAGIGGVHSWLAPDAVQFIISRGVVGFGYGLSLMAAQGFVVRYSDRKSKAQGLAQIFAGLYAGNICGAAAGAMLAERYGFAPVFLIGAIVLLGAAIYTAFSMREAFVLPPRRASTAKSKDNKDVPVREFMLNRRVLNLMLFSSLPASIAVVGFLNYFSPIYLDRLGASQSTIGYVIVVYGLCLIYLGPAIGKLVDNAEDKQGLIFLGCLIGAAAFLFFPILNGVTAVIVALVLLGVSSSFVLSAQSAYVLKLRVTKELGEGKALGIFRSTSRIGQVLGPIIFASVVTVAAIESVVTYMGVAYLVAAMCFIILIKKGKKPRLARAVR